MHVSNKLRHIDCNNCPLLPCKGLWGWKYSFEKSLYFFSFWQNFETHCVKLSTVSWRAIEFLGISCNGKESMKTLQVREKTSDLVKSTYPYKKKMIDKSNK